MELIAVVDEKWGLGRGNDLLFHLPPDMKHFRALTTGKVMVLGRKTLDSFPGGNPLPKREHLVLTRDPQSVADRSVQAVSDLSELFALLRADAYAQKDICVIGGAEIYRQLLPYCSVAHITHVYADGKATCFLPDLGNTPGWALAEIGPLERYDLLEYAFATYVNHEPLPF